MRYVYSFFSIIWFEFIKNAIETVWLFKYKSFAFILLGRMRHRNNVTKLERGYIGHPTAALSAKNVSIYFLI